MSDRNDAACLGTLEEVHEVRGDPARRIVLERGWFRRTAVPQQVGRDDAVASLGEEGDLVAPVVRGRGEAVDEEQGRLRRVLGRGDEGVVGVSGLGEDVFVRAGIHCVCVMRGLEGEAAQLDRL